MNPLKTAKLFAYKMRHANYGRVVERARAAGETSHRTTAGILCDVLWCSMRYGAAFTDYFMFEFYQKPAAERREFITMSQNNRLIAAMNCREDRHVLDRKTDLVRTYRDFMHREILILADASREQVLEFIARHPAFFAKKNFTFSAKGVERFEVSEVLTAEAAYDRLKNEGFDLIEQPVVQHPELARMYPGSVNTLRVVTAVKDGVCEIVFAALKTGNGAAVDNMNAGGLSAAIDVRTGRVYTDAIVKNGGHFAAHPATDVPYKGFQIPMWEQVRELVAQVCRVTPGLRFVGWDVAVTPDGPILIEGNYIPGYDLLQLPDMTGRMWIVRKYANK